MGKKEEYKEKNLRFLEEVATGEGVVKLPCGVLYKEIEKGTGVVSPELTDVVSVHYRGTLANGREFDNSWKRGCPEAFRLNQVIEGWQEALRRMHVGRGRGLLLSRRSDRQSKQLRIRISVRHRY